MANVNKYYQGIISNLTKKIEGNVKDAHVKDATIISSQTEGAFKPEITWDSTLRNIIPSVIGDSTSTIAKYNLQYPAVAYKDRWLNLKGNLHPDSTWTYTMYDSINIVGYEKKTGFLKHEIFIDVTSNNPHTKIESLKAFRIQPKPKTWGIGISAGYIFRWEHH